MPSASSGWMRRLNQILSLSVIGVSLLTSLPLSAEELQKLLQRGHLTIGVKENLRPLGFRNAAGELQGFEIDIARRLSAELLGRSDALTLKPLLNRDRLSTLLNGQVDLVIAQMTATEARSRVVSFSQPYYADGTALVTKRPMQQIQDVNQQRVAVLEGSSTIDVLRYRLPGAILVPVASYEAALAQLEAGDAVALAADASVLAGWIQTHPTYHLLTPVLWVEPLCVVLPKGMQYDALRRRINEILQRWQAEAWLEARARYWGLPYRDTAPKD
jgi:polar amino acid transport system substrate-binding protein